MSRTNKLFMAVAKGKVSSEGGDIKRYIGVAPVFVLAVNPTKSKLEEIYGTTIENDPVYIGETEVGEDKKKVAQVRLDFIVKIDGEKCKDVDGTSIDAITRVSFFIRNQYRTNTAGDKVQVIDKYGRTAWVTKEQFSKKEIPMYSNGPANLDKDYRACFWGEEQLTNFIRAYLNIPNVMKYVNKQWVLIDNPEEAEVRLDDIANYFKGNFAELNEILTYQPQNKVKLLFGVRTTDDNRQFQAVYTEMFLKNGVTDYSRLDKDVQERKNAGAYSTTEFEVCDLKVYHVGATPVSSLPNNTDMPDFTGTAPNPWEDTK